MVNKGINVMIVDELSPMRKIIKSFLRNLGFENIQLVEDGSKALSVLKQDSFDLVISALHMSNMDGLELLKTIRSDENLKGIRFLLVTAEAKKENIIMAIKSGANNFIVKPFTEEVLQKKLEEIFNITV